MLYLIVRGESGEYCMIFGNGMIRVTCAGREKENQVSSAKVQTRKGMPLNDPYFCLSKMSCCVSAFRFYRGCSCFLLISAYL